MTALKVHGAVAAGPTHAMAFRAGCFALLHLVRDATNAQRMVRNGVRVILQGLRAHGSDAEIQRDGLDVLATAMRSQRTRAKATESATTAASTTDPETTDAPTDRVAAASDSSEQKIIALGGLTTVLTALRRHPADVPLWRAALDVLGGLAGPRAAAVVDGGVFDDWLPAHLTCTAALAGDTVTVRKLLRLVRWCAETEVLAVRAAVATPPMLILVVTVLQTHATSASVQQEGALALAWLAQHDAATAQCLTDAGALVCCVGMLKAHATVVHVQHTGCLAIGWLAHYHAQQVALREAGAIEQVMATMTTHAGTAEVQAAGCFALRALAGDATNRGCIRDAFGFTLVIAAMTRHPGDSEVQHKACVCLEWFAITHDVRRALVQGGAVPAVVHALATHARHDAIQTAGTYVLNALAAVPDHCPRIVHCGGAKLVRRALAAFPANTPLQDVGYDVLTKLAPAERRQYDVYLFVGLTLVLLVAIYYYEIIYGLFATGAWWPLE